MTLRRHIASNSGELDWCIQALALTERKGDLALGLARITSDNGVSRYLAGFFVGSHACPLTSGLCHVPGEGERSGLPFPATLTGWSVFSDDIW